MIGPLLVAVAHGIDLLTFLLVLPRYGPWGETAPVMGAILATTGLVGVVSVKVVGTVLAALIVARRPRYLPLAAGAGIAYAATNVAALSLLG